MSQQVQCCFLGVSLAPDKTVEWAARVPSVLEPRQTA